jgi:hypothetical protein
MADALLLADWSAGSRRDARIAMIEITIKTTCQIYLYAVY